VDADNLKHDINRDPKTTMTQWLEYDNMIQELRSLRSGITSHNKASASSGIAHIILRAQPPRLLDAIGNDAGTDLDENMHHSSLAHIRSHLESESENLGCASFSKKILSATARIYVSYTGTGRLQNVIVTIAVPAWIRNSTPIVMLTAIRGESTPLTLQCTLAARSSIPPSEMRVKVTTSFSANEIPYCSSTKFRLPMCLACEMVLPSKREATYRLTIQTDKEAVRGATAPPPPDT